MNYTIKNYKEKQWQDKTFVTADLTDTEGKTEEIAFWKNEINPESKEIEGEISTNDKGKRVFRTPRQSAGNNFVSKQKEESIAKFQDKKAEQIHAAQDRSAWMWAKNSASTLIAGHPSFLEMDPKLIDKAVASLATKIYNAEPDTPF